MQINAEQFLTLIIPVIWTYIGHVKCQILPGLNFMCSGQFEEYSRCSAGCVVGCDNLNLPLSCPTCTAGCVCKQGYVRETSTNRNCRCVHRSVCGTSNNLQCTDINSQFNPCKPSCVETCSGNTCNYASNCGQGCVCQNGYIRQTSDINSPCILRSQCLNPIPPYPNSYPNSCTDANMYFSQCGTACPDTCQGQASSCSMPCIQGCFCNSGFVREAALGNTRCIRREQCPSVQQPLSCTDLNEVFSFCGTACQENCQAANAVCSMQCIQGCFCRPGYVRESSAFGARCILRSLCFSSIQGNGQCSDPNSQYFTCAPACEETCDTSPQVCGQACRQGCFCKPGYSKMNNNLGSYCVLKSQCIFYGGLNPSGGYNPYGGYGQPSGGFNPYGGYGQPSGGFELSGGYNPTGGQKPGACPDLGVDSQQRVRNDQCSTDNDCLNQEKCCYTLVGNQCMVPEIVARLNNCQLNEEYTSCTRTCSMGCDNYLTVGCPSSCGPPGCQCISGFVRQNSNDIRSYCIPANTCTAFG